MVKSIMVLLLALVLTGGLLIVLQGIGSGGVWCAKETAQAPEAEACTCSWSGVEAFVAKHLATAKTLQDWTAEAAPQAMAEVRAASNYATLPPQYRALLEANAARATRFSGDYRMVSPYWGAEFRIDCYKDRLVVYHYTLDSSKMMATFEPAVGAQPFLKIPKATLASFSEADRAWAERLLAIVNENMAFLFDVPFFVPEMALFRCNGYGGKFIPEKYLITGDKVDALPAGMVKAEERGLRKRWGVPIYDLSKVETAGIKDYSMCAFWSAYKAMRVVDQLVLLNFDMMEHEQESLELIRRVQYRRAHADLELLEAAVKREEAALKARGEWTPSRKWVLGEVRERFQDVMPRAKNLLARSIADNRFITTLREPEAKPALARQRDVLAPAPTTCGTIPPSL